MWPHYSGPNKSSSVIFFIQRTCLMATLLTRPYFCGSLVTGLTGFHCTPVILPYEWTILVKSNWTRIENSHKNLKADMTESPNIQCSLFTSISSKPGPITLKFVFLEETNWRQWLFPTHVILFWQWFSTKPDSKMDLNHSALGYTI